MPRASKWHGMPVAVRIVVIAVVVAGAAVAALEYRDARERASAAELESTAGPLTPVPPVGSAPSRDELVAAPTPSPSPIAEVVAEARRPDQAAPPPPAPEPEPALAAAAPTADPAPPAADPVRRAEPMLVPAAPRSVFRPADPVPAAPRCGEPGRPECPLQRWMDQRLNGPLAQEATAELVKSFRYLAAIAPQEFPDWGAWALNGAESASRGDFEAIKRSCTGCHDDYRARYRKEMRARALPPAR